MSIQDMLAQASWRLHGFFGAQASNARVGVRRDAYQCPLIEWLIQEQDWGPDLRSLCVGPESVFVAGATTLLPLTLQLFLDWVDCAFGNDIVLAGEALNALAHAERSAAQRLLTEARCDYTDLDGQRCQRSARNRFIYCFIEDYPVAGQLPQRACCREFAGRLCEECWRHLRLVVPPANWWGESSGTLLRLARARRTEEALVCS